MRTISAVVAVFSLFTAVALVPAVGGILIGAVLVGLFGLALTGVLASLDDTTVPQRNPDMDPTRWRNGT
jgi:hypothetical protein